MKQLFTTAFLAVSLGFGASTSAFAAGEYVFTDDRCKQASKYGISCWALPKPAPASAFSHHGNFDLFVKLNRNSLPANVTPKTILPANTVYVVDSK